MISLNFKKNVKDFSLVTIERNNVIFTYKGVVSVGSGS